MGSTVTALRALGTAGTRSIFVREFIPDVHHIDKNRHNDDRENLEKQLREPALAMRRFVSLIRSRNFWYG
jgi:hypothetical protein